MTPELGTPFAVVCHDAGAANIVIAWINAEGLVTSARPFMRGPAEKIWRDTFPAAAMCETIEECLSGVRAVLTGTGWASDVEHHARQMAATAGLHSVAVIDHWVNYEPRFERQGARALPGELWVADDHAAKIARDTFPGIPVLVMPNYYLERIVRSIAAVPAGGDILYVLEPERRAWGDGRPGEFQALDYFIEMLPQLGIPPGTLIRLRPHPSDPPGKYEPWLATHSGTRAEIDASASLGDALSRARWVAGCESMAMVVALKAGRTVFSTLPPFAPPCSLPHAELVHLTKIGTRQ